MATAVLEAFYALVAISALFFAIHRSQQHPKNAYMTWFAFGFLFNLFSLSWLYTALPLPWFPDGFLQYVVLTGLLFLLACVCGAAFAIVGYAFSKPFPFWEKLILFTTLLAGAEIARSLLISATLYGDESNFGLHWNAGTLGEALSITPLVEYAYVGGVYALTGVLGALVFTCTHWKKEKRWYIPLLFIALGWVMIHTIIPTRGPMEGATVSVITTNVKHDEQESNLKEAVARWRPIHEATLSLEKINPDLIIYPESTAYLRYADNPTITTLRSTLPNAHFLDGDTRTMSGSYSNFSILYPPEGKAMLGRGKVLLFPFNEYVPWLAVPLMKFALTRNEYDTYAETHAYMPFSNFVSFATAFGNVGTLICSELSSFNAVREISKTKPNIVIVQSNLELFDGKDWFSIHYRMLGRIAAAQMRVPLIANNNGMESFTINQYGKLLDSFPQGENIYNLTTHEGSVKRSN